MKLSENIKILRKERNLRQEQLAEAMGVSTASVSKWETGQCAPELTVLMELADYFEVSIDTLMGHSVNSERMDGLIQEMEQAANKRDETIAITICEKLLRNYPDCMGNREGVAVHPESDLADNYPSFARSTGL